MKKIKRIACILIIILSSLSAHAAERPLVIVGEAWPPFEYVDHGKTVGIDIDVIDYIFDKLQIDYEVKILPWKRAWQNIEFGEADAVLSTSRKEERKPFLYYPEEDMWMSEYVFFAKGNINKPVSIDYEEAKSKNFKVGIIAGNSYHKSFWGAYPYNNDGSLNDLLHESYDVQTNITLLANGRIDLYIVDKIIGAYTVKMMKLGDKITYSDKTLFSKGYPMPFAKKSTYPNIEKISKSFEAELKQLKKTEKYQEIMDKWLK